MTYDERVRAIAEEMAGGPLEGLKKVWYIVYMNNARIAVKHMADAYERGFNGGYDFSDDSDMMSFCNECMIREGLIPDSEPDILPINTFEIVQPGDRMYGKGYNSDNPEPENWKL